MTHRPGELSGENNSGWRCRALRVPSCWRTSRPEIGSDTAARMLD